MSAQNTDQPTKKTVGDVIRAARKAKGWTQVELAERAGLSQRWVSDIERRDTRSPRLATLKSLASTLDLDLAELVIVAEMARTKAEADSIVDETRDDDPLLDAIMLDLHNLTPEGRRRAREMITMIRQMEAERNGGSQGD